MSRKTSPRQAIEQRKVYSVRESLKTEIANPEADKIVALIRTKIGKTDWFDRIPNSTEAFIEVRIMRGLLLLSRNGTDRTI